MYDLQDSVLSVKGIGANFKESLADHQIEQVLDLLLFLPLRYEDRSAIKSIAEIKNLNPQETVIVKSEENQKVKTNFVTTKAKILKYNEHRKGRLLISRATIADSSGELVCVWFNNKFLKNKFVTSSKDQEYFFSGNLKDGSLMQAIVEKIDTSSEESSNIHTGRLVPIYSQLADLKQGNLRRILAETISKLHQSGELEQLFRDLHFPASIDRIITAREKLALEEILYLMGESAKNKQLHQKKSAKFTLSPEAIPQLENLQLPFELTAAQRKALSEIYTDLSGTSPMNRLLVGDVGSGKTIVAAIPGCALVANGQNVCLLAPTKILAQQHYQNLKSIFGTINFALVSSDKPKSDNQTPANGETPTFYIGTHSLLNQLKNIKPSLVIYDEQQRFGVKHRQLDEYLDQRGKQPHLLSMTATPIPRSLMLSIFSHLDLSYLDQMPNSRTMATTWLVPDFKKKKALEWLIQELLPTAVNTRKKQALIICPFINPSSYKATENVTAVKESLSFIKKELKQIYEKLAIPVAKQPKVGALHSKLEKTKQAKIINDVYAEKIQILVSTPMVEVGVDLPNADIIVIQSAERFGLSSLHQLRGRVGRKGQASYCLLFSSSESTDPASSDRLKKFCHEKDGLKLAQLDLENRGAGNLLGYNQSGLNDLRFASWTNTSVINQAQEIFKKNTHHQSFLKNYLEKINSAKTVDAATN